MTRRLTRITVAVLCFGLALSPVTSAQSPDRLRVVHLGVVWPGGAMPGSGTRPSVLVLSAKDVLAEATDPPGDMQPPVAWMPFQRPGRDVTVGADSLQIDLPTFMLHSPQSSFSWSVDARALTDGTLHDSLDQQGTWQPGGTSTVTDPVDQGVNDYADLTQASVRSLDPQRVRFELQVRGNTAGAWDKEMYLFSLFPFSTQQWDTWLYLVPWVDPPQSWFSQVIYNPAVAPAPTLPYLDITSSRVTREGGDIVLETTVADIIPQGPDTGPAIPMFTWLFSVLPDGGASGGGAKWAVLIAALALVEAGPLLILCMLHVMGNPEWVPVGQLPGEISGNTVRVRVPAAQLPLDSALLLRPSTGFSLGDDPEAYVSEVDWTDGMQLARLGQRIYLPIILRGS
jgi:hypothetical protein